MDKGSIVLTIMKTEIHTKFQPEDLKGQKDMEYLALIKQ
jgi:hypothetical protein